MLTCTCVRRILVTAFLLGCGQILGVSDWVVDDASTSGDAPPSDAGPTDAGVCRSPREGGLDGVLVQNEFCIDKTETPVAVYNVFLNDINTDPSMGQGPECAWNTTYAQSYDPFDAADPQHDQRPITAVDWCDAVAFCKYFGKHLCGARGDGGPLPFDAEAKKGQWYTACTNGTSQAYPYGATFDQSKCNANIAQGDGSVLPVGTPTSCQGGVPGLFDMSGNAQEWENSCENDVCHLRGGPYFFEFDWVTCDKTGGGNDNGRDAASPYNTIRCCWEP